MNDRHDHLWNKDLERAVLGVVLDGRHATAWGTLVQHVPHPGFFFARDHRLIYLAMAAIADRGERIDALAVQNECAATVWREAAERLKWLQLMEDGATPPDRRLLALPPPTDGLSYEDSVLVAIGGFNAVNDLALSFAPVSSLEANCKLLVDHYRQRRLLKLVESARATLESPKGVRAVQEVGTLLINSASQALGQATGDVTMAAAIDEALVLGDQVAEHGGAGYASWGVAQLDRMVPLTRDTFAVLAAGPKCGKTSLMMQAVEATAALGGADSVCVVSREMSPAELARILVARRLGIPATSVRDGTLTLTERRQVAEEAERWRRDPSVVIQADADRVTIDDICAWARLRATRAAGRLRLIVIDYLQLLDGIKPTDREYDRVSYATRRCKLLQRSLRVPVLLLSQFSREGTKANRNAAGEVGLPPEPQLSDLRGSGTIEQDANAVVMLWPRQAPTGAVQSVTVKIAANRAGEVGSIDCHFMRAHGQVFREVVVEALNERTKRMETVPSDDEDQFG
jgi:replicative DNA helicase